jgi:hypothetical protein
MSSAAKPHRPRRLSRRFWLGLALLLVAVVLLANVHLVYVAITSQPPCVPHLQVADGGNTTYRAAKSVC